MMTAHCIECGGGFTRSADETWKVRCLPCWRRTKDRTAAPEVSRTVAPAAPLDAGRVRQLLQLCHPDRHGGSELAHAVTQWLLKLRGELRA